MEKLTNKEKIGLLLGACGMSAALVISWGCPEVFFGWSLWAICGAWLGMTAVFAAAVGSAAFLMRLVSGLHRMAIEKESREAVQLYGREWMYVRPAGGRYDD